MSVEVIERLVALPSVSRAGVEDDVLAAKPSPEVSGPCWFSSANYEYQYS